MNDEQEQLYREGYAAYLEGVEEHGNPYSNLDAEYWSDGWEDAKDDQVGQ